MFHRQPAKKNANRAKLPLFPLLSFDAAPMFAASALLCCLSLTRRVLPSSPALQLPLANDGGSRSSSSESSPQHHPYPSRPRHMLTLPTPPYGLQKSLEKYVVSSQLSVGTLVDSAKSRLSFFGFVFLSFQPFFLIQKKKEKPHATLKCPSLMVILTSI